MLGLSAKNAVNRSGDIHVGAADWVFFHLSQLHAAAALRPFCVQLRLLCGSQQSLENGAQQEEEKENEEYRDQQSHQKIRCRVLAEGCWDELPLEAGSSIMRASSAMEEFPGSTLFKRSKAIRAAAVSFLP